MDIISATWTHIGLAIVVGAAIIYFSPEEGFYKVLGHFGIGLFVAALVATFWQLREVKEFFLSVARAVLIDDAYLAKLGRGSQRELRLAAESAILGDLTKNPEYDYRGLGKWIDNVLFERSLPSDAPNTGVYRERYRDVITLELISLRAVLDEVKGPADEVPAANLDSEVMRITTINRYTAMAPRADPKDYKHYPVPLSGKSSDMPHFPLAKRVRFWVGTSEKDAKEVEVVIADNPRGGIEFEAKMVGAIEFVDGRAEVWTKLVEYKLPNREPFALGTMSSLTHDLYVEARMVRSPKRYVFDGNVISFAGEKEIEYPSNGIVLEYPGWLFEDHGYLIWWWEDNA
jgi:hypothetical protein